MLPLHTNVPNNSAFVYRSSAGLLEAQSMHIPFLCMLSTCTCVTRGRGVYFWLLKIRGSVISNERKQLRDNRSSISTDGLLI